MKSDQEQVKKAAQKIGKKVGAEKSEEYKKLLARATEGGFVPKNMLGLSDDMVEGIYGQAYRLYNTGKFKEAVHLFRTLMLLDTAETKYTLGLAASLHMLKEFKAATEIYTMCGILDVDNPIPHYHSSDCFIQMNDPVSASVCLEMAVKRCGTKPEFKVLKDRSKMTLKSLNKEIKKKPKKKKK